VIGEEVIEDLHGDEAIEDFHGDQKPLNFKPPLKKSPF